MGQSYLVVERRSRRTGRVWVSTTVMGCVEQLRPVVPRDGHAYPRGTEHVVE